MFSCLTSVGGKLSHIALVLCQGGGELVLAGGGIQHIEVVIAGGGGQSGLQAGKTRIGDGAGSQTGVLVGVVGMSEAMV